jgi:uncharacterized protein (TIGR00290 family)
MMHKAFFSWSGGKDSVLALYHVLKEKKYSVDKFLTTFNQLHQRVTMHGVREELLQQQADALGINLHKVMLPHEPDMAQYERQMTLSFKEMKEENLSHAVFGDIFLEDLKAYREAQLARMQITAVFPLWKRDTRELMREFIDLGFKTVVVCANAQLLDRDFIGRIIDHDFLKTLPANVDACGENGEFHTFVFDGPLFKQPVRYTIGEKVYQEYKTPASASQNASDNVNPATTGFWFCDLVPALP